MLLLQHGANVDSVTKDLYTSLHIAAKEDQEEVRMSSRNISDVFRLHFSVKYIRISYIFAGCPNFTRTRLIDDCSYEKRFHAFTFGREVR